MKPLFTIHGGEYLFANEVEAKFPKLRIWLPGKDIGLDFLLTDEKCLKPLTIQVKYSRDFNWSKGAADIKEHIKSTGWYSINRKKLTNSTADYWVLLNYDGFRRATDFLFIKPADLLNKFNLLKRKGTTIQSYITITDTRKAFDIRDLGKKEQPKVLDGSLDGGVRDFTPYLNKWDIIKTHFGL
jgi:hypothetical protein